MKIYQFCQFSLVLAGNRMPKLTVTAAKKAVFFCCTSCFSATSNSARGVTLVLFNKRVLKVTAVIGAAVIGVISFLIFQRCFSLCLLRFGVFSIVFFSADRFRDFLVNCYVSRLREIFVDYSVTQMLCVCFSFHFRH